MPLSQVNGSYVQSFCPNLAQNRAKWGQIAQSQFIYLIYQHQELTPVYDISPIHASNRAKLQFRGITASP